MDGEIHSPSAITKYFIYHNQLRREKIYTFRKVLENGTFGKLGKTNLHVFECETNSKETIFFFKNWLVLLNTQEKLNGHSLRKYIS